MPGLFKKKYRIASARLQMMMANQECISLQYAQPTDIVSLAKYKMEKCNYLKLEGLRNRYG